MTGFVAQQLYATPLGYRADTRCRSLSAGNGAFGDICSDAATRRWHWLVLVLAVFAVLAIAGVVALVRARPLAPPPPRRTVGVLVLAAGAAVLAYSGANVLGAGRDPDYCASPISGTGRYPYEADKPQQCAPQYSADLAAGWWRLGGAAALLGVAAVVAFASPRNPTSRRDP